MCQDEDIKQIGDYFDLHNSKISRIIRNKELGVKNYDLTPLPRLDPIPPLLI